MNLHDRTDTFRTTPHWRRACGFTLVELMVTLAVFAILITLAVPSFESITSTIKTKNGASDIYIALARTRSEAIKFNQTVTLSAKTGGWQNGWQLTNPNTGAVMEDHNALSGITITTTPSSTNSISYNSYGRLQGGSLSLEVKSNGTHAAPRCVTIDLTGKPYLKASTC